MKRREGSGNAAGSLRTRAESQLGSQPPPRAAAADAGALQRLVQELQIHQIELELQNEELKQAQATAEASAAKFNDLYDFAPVGYFTLAADGTIALANLTGAKLVGIDRSRLIGRRFGLLISAPSRPDFNAFLAAAFADDTIHTQDFELCSPDRPPRQVSIEAQRLPDGTECRATVADISHRARATEMLRLLWETADALLTASDPAAMLGSLFALIRPTLNVDAYFVQLLDTQPRTLRLVASAGNADVTVPLLQRCHFGQTLSGLAASTEQPVIAAHLPQLREPKADVYRSQGFRAVVCHPLLAGSSLLGTLTYASRARAEFDPDELIVLQTIAHYVSLVYERWHTTGALNASEVRYRRLFEAAQDGVVLLDPTTRKITDVNPFMTKLLGFSRDQLVGKELFQIGLLKDQAANVAMVRKLKRTHQVRYDNLPLSGAGGRRQEVEVVANLYGENGRPVIQCNVRDITARKRVEALLRRNEALFAALIEQAPVGVFVVDAAFNLQQVNPVARPIFAGIRPLIGQPLPKVLQVQWPRRIAAEIVAHFRHTLATGEAYQSPEFKEQRRDTGKHEVYEWQIQQIVLPAGERGVVCFFTDITDRRRVEAERRQFDILTASNAKLRQSEQRAQQLLQQARQLQEKLRHISHQILQAQELQRKEISHELHDKITQLLIGINVHLAIFTKAAVAKPQQIRHLVIPLRQLVRNAVRAVHQFARDLRPAMLDDLGLIPALRSLVEHFPKRKGRQIQLTAFEGAEALDNDRRTVVYRITQEALNNTAKHSRAKRVTVTLRKSAGAAILEISDDGVAFDVARLSSTRWSRRLGLTGMRERVEMVGGRFSVDSVPGRGTTVRAEIPFGKSLEVSE